MTKKRKTEMEDSQTSGEVTTEATTPSEESRNEGEATAPSEESMEASQEEARKNWDLYLRARADLENYRKRAQREKEDLARFANENILREMLPVLDNLERAVDHARKDGSGGEGLLQGIEMTISQFGRALEKFGVAHVPSMGEPFDPARHEAMGQVETSEHPPNTVVQELQKGYMLSDRLLRPALVMVAKAPPAETK